MLREGYNIIPSETEVFVFWMLEICMDLCSTCCFPLFPLSCADGRKDQWMSVCGRSSILCLSISGLLLFNWTQY